MFLFLVGLNVFCDETTNVMSWLVSQFENHKDEIQKFLHSMIIVQNKKHYVDDKKTVIAKIQTLYNTTLYNLRLQSKCKAEVDKSDNKQEQDQKVNDSMNISDGSVQENISKFDVCGLVIDEKLYFCLLGCSLNGWIKILPNNLLHGLYL